MGVPESGYPCPPVLSGPRLRLVLVLALAAAGFGWWLGVHNRGSGLDEVRIALESGSPDALVASADRLAAGRGPCLGSAAAVALGQRWVDGGEDPEAARAAIGAAADEHDKCSDYHIAVGLLAVADGDLVAASAAVATAHSYPASLVAPDHLRWLQGIIAVAEREPTALATAVADFQTLTSAKPGAVVYQRWLARLLMATGAVDEATAVITAVRTADPSSLRLSADWAVHHAVLRRELSGVADLADQLQDLAQTPHDRGRTLLARAVVHVHAGEPAAGLSRLDLAWSLLPWWDWHARTAALELALEAGDSDRARIWSKSWPAVEQRLYAAWSLYVEGDVMAALQALAELPQDHARVAYLQGLALVEQRRFAEAEPWLARADRMLPGRIEIEVARARVAVHTGDQATALRTLTGLAASEAYAPRAHTGLGEAILAQAPDQRDLRAARRALTRAVEREPRAAEAMLLLAGVWDRSQAPEASRNALQWYQQAAATNPRLPRYREALARHLAEIGQSSAAETLLRELLRESGIAAETPLLLARVVLARETTAAARPEVAAWLAEAETLGAATDQLERARAHHELAVGTPASLRSAQKRLEQLLATTPDDVDSRVLLVRVRMAQRDDEAAEQLIRQGIYSIGVAASGRLYLAWARLELRQHKRKMAAIHARSAMRRMFDEGRPAVELLDAAELAITLFTRSEQETLAVAVARELVARLPDNDHAWRLAARAHHASGSASKARDAVLKAIELGPEVAENYEFRAQVALRSGDRKSAVAALEQALACCAHDPAVHTRMTEQLRRITR